MRGVVGSNCWRCMVHSRADQEKATVITVLGPVSRAVIQARTAEFLYPLAWACVPSPAPGLRAQPSPRVLGLWEQENRKRLAIQGGLLEGSRDRKDLTSSLLFLPRRLAVTPLWFVGPREHLHYITPDTTAPKM